VKALLTTCGLPDPCLPVKVKVFSTPLIVRIAREYARAGLTLCVVGACAEDAVRVLKAYGLSAQAGTPDVEAGEEVLVARADTLFSVESLRAIAESRGETAFQLGSEVVALKLTGKLIKELWGQPACTPLSALCERITDLRGLPIVDLSADSVAIFKTGPSFERWLLRRAQKGVHFTSKLNAPLENALVRLVGRFNWVTPNRITLLVNALAAVPLVLFLQGSFVAGSLAAYLVGILDGVDGKLARVRGVASKLGLLEHTADTLYELAWYAAYALGCYNRAMDTLALVLGFAMLIANSYIKHLYLQFHIASGATLKEAGSLGRAFAKVDGRRNTYILYFLLLSALGVPVYGLALSLTHAAITALVYTALSVKHLRG